MKRMIFVGLVMIVSCLFLGGCVKPYKKPILEAIEPNESAILIPLEGDTSKQAVFSSIDKIEKNLVATKRVEIPQRWLQTERFYYNGKWVPTAQLIKVSRSPEVREWTESGSGTSNANQAIVGESRESIMVIARMNCIGMIKESDIPKFLYFYAGKPLAEVMDTTVRAEVERGFVEGCAKYYLRDEGENGLLNQKQTIMETIRKRVTSVCAEQGITITTLGLKGEFSYTKEVQDSINQRFVSRQNQQKAQADAAVAQMLKNSGGMEYQLKLRQQEINKDLQRETIRKWDGKLPTTIMGNSSIPMLSLNPAPAK